MEEGQKISNLGEVYITGGKSESLWNERGCCNRFRFMLGICYRPPHQSYHKEYEVACESKRVCDKGKTLLMGDYLDVNWNESEVRLW